MGGDGIDMSRVAAIMGFVFSVAVIASIVVN